jgi:hypothetical protein
LQAATIKVFLAHGIPDGLRTAEISNWTGKAIACPRSHLRDLLSRDEMIGPGVYLLTGADPDTGAPALYIGEAEKVGQRLKSHSDKDYWVSVIVFVSKDENLTKAHVKYLEGKLINRVEDAGKASLINTSSSGAKLPESDTAEMDVFLDKIYQLLPILGVDLFTPLETTFLDDKQLLYCKIKGLMARGRRTTSGFVVFKGSQAVFEHRRSATYTKTTRENLLKYGLLVKEKDHYVFSKNVEFSSPSMASSVVRGGASNGLTSWKTANGKSLKELEREI